MNLYEITTEIQSILDAMLEGGADSPEAMDALNEHLSGLDAVLDTKAEQYAGIITELQSRAAIRSQEAKRVSTLAAADQALADRLKERLKESMERTGKTKIETARFKLSVAGNGGKQPLAIGCDAHALPPEFVVQRVEANKDAIRAALEAGRSIPDCSLLPRGTSIRIR